MGKIVKLDKGFKAAIFNDKFPVKIISANKSSPEGI